MGGGFQLNTARILIFTCFAFFRGPKFNFWSKIPKNRDFWVFLQKIELWTPKKGKKSKKSKFWRY